MTPNKIKKAIVIAAICILCLIAFVYWIYSRLYLSTEDAYVGANITHISSNVTGQVSNLYVKDNQYVKAGDVLLDLDPINFQLAIEQAKAKLAMDKAKLMLADQTAARILELSKKKMLSVQDSDNAKANFESAKAQVDADQASLAQAVLNLKYTQIVAPNSGWLNNVTLNKGDAVMANQPLFTLVNDNEFWVDANFKETDLQDIHTGQKAKVEVDMYKDHIFSGVVESISHGSGAAFSLLPPENATGNWVKVTQRVPVRIRILNPNPNFPLRVGTTATVTLRIN